MIVYRFLHAQYALQALQTGSLKVGRLSELNDPMDCAPRLINYPARTVDVLNERFEQELIRNAGATVGLICFSEAVDDPVVWSHYADGHRGVALGFNFRPERQPIKVRYQSERAQLDYSRLKNTRSGIDIEAFESGFTRKAPSWNYEKEHRAFVRLDSCEMRGEHYFIPMPQLDFCHVVLGVRCQLIANDFLRLLKGFRSSKVQVFRAKSSADTYRLDLGGEDETRII